MDLRRLRGRPIPKKTMLSPLRTAQTHIGTHGRRSSRRTCAAVSTGSGGIDDSVARADAGGVKRFSSGGRADSRTGAGQQCKIEARRMDLRRLRGGPIPNKTMLSTLRTAQTHIGTHGCQSSCRTCIAVLTGAGTSITAETAWASGASLAWLRHGTPGVGPESAWRNCRDLSEATPLPQCWRC